MAQRYMPPWRRRLQDQIMLGANIFVLAPLVIMLVLLIAAVIWVHLHG